MRKLHENLCIFNHSKKNRFHRNYSRKYSMQVHQGILNLSTALPFTFPLIIYISYVCLEKKMYYQNQNEKMKWDFVIRLNSLWSVKSRNDVGYQKNRMVDSQVTTAFPCFYHGCTYKFNACSTELGALLTKLQFLHSNSCQ